MGLYNKQWILVTNHTHPVGTYFDQATGVVEPGSWNYDPTEAARYHHDGDIEGYHYLHKQALARRTT